MKTQQWIYALTLFSATQSCLAASYQITFEGQISHATTGNLSAYNLGVGDTVSFTIGVTEDYNGYALNSDGSKKAYGDSGSPGYGNYYDDYFYANYIDGNFMQDSTVIEPHAYTSYYGREAYYYDKYAGNNDLNVWLLHNTNRLNLSAKGYYYRDDCQFCVDQAFYFTQTVTNFDSIFGTAYITSVVEAQVVPLLPAHWLFISGMALLGGLGRLRNKCKH